jgi:hypothetical protein
VWNDTTPGYYVAGYATGGGISGAEAKPGYQLAVTTPSTSYRTVPDVAFDADPNNGSGASVYDAYDGTGTPNSSPWIVEGGTSLGAPAWSGLIAIADQLRVANSLSDLSGGSQTLPAIYDLPSSDFHDIVNGINGSTGNNTLYNSNGTAAYAGYSASVGYDVNTGRGTPIANSLVPDLASTLIVSDMTGGGATITLGSGSIGVTVNGGTTSYSSSYTKIDFHGLSSSDTLTVNTDGTVGVNGTANGAGTMTVGSRAIAFQNAGTLNLEGISGVDYFTVNSWAGGTLNLGTVGGSVFLSNSVTLHLGSTAINGGTVSVTGSAGHTFLSAYGDGSLGIGGSTTSGTITGTGASVAFADFAGVTMSGTGAASDQFAVNSWTGGSLNINTAGTFSTNSISVYFSSSGITAGSVAIGTGTAGSGTLDAYGDSSLTVTGTSTGTMTDSSYGTGTVYFYNFATVNVTR